MPHLVSLVTALTVGLSDLAVRVSLCAGKGEEKRVKD